MAVTIPREYYPEQSAGVLSPSYSEPKQPRSTPIDRAQAIEAALRLNTASDADALIAQARKIEAYLTGRETA